MSQQSEQDVQVEIVKTLVSINDITHKIEKELTSIVDLVREKGRLRNAVDSANLALSNRVREMEINTGPSDESEDNREIENLAIPMTPNSIMEKLMSIIGEGRES